MGRKLIIKKAFFLSLFVLSLSFLIAENFVPNLFTHKTHISKSNLITSQRLVLIHDDPMVVSNIKGNKICSKRRLFLKGKLKIQIRDKVNFNNNCFDISQYKNKLRGGKELIHVGDNSDVYQLVDFIIYEGNGFNITASLKNTNGSYAKGTAWINNDSLKFGYNLSDTSWKRRRYEVYSTLPIKRTGDIFYFVDGSTYYKIDTKDICSQYNDIYGGSNCYFSTWSNFSIEDNKTYNYIDIDFNGNNTDPTIIINQISSNLGLNQTRWEEENYTHLAVNNSNIVAYYPLDAGSNETLRDYSYNDNDLSSYVQGDSYSNYADGVIGKAINTSYVSTNYYGVEYSTSSYPEFNQDTNFTFSYWINASKPFYSKFYDANNFYDPIGFGFTEMDLKPSAFVSNFTIYDNEYIGSVSSEGIDINSQGYVFAAMTSYFLKVYKYNSSTNKLDYLYNRDDGTYAYYPSVINGTKVAVYSSDAGYRIYLYDWNGTSLNLIQNTTAYFDKNIRRMKSMGNYLFEISYYGGLGVWEWNGTELIKKGNYTSSIIDSRDMKVYKTADDEYTIFSASGGHYYVYKYNSTSDEVILADTGEAPSANEYGIDYDSQRGLVFGSGNGDLDVFSWDGTNLNLLGHFDTGIANSRDRYGALFYNNYTGNIIMQRYYMPTMIYRYNETTNNITFIGRLFETKSSVWQPKFYDGKMISMVYRNIYLIPYYNAEGIQSINPKINTWTNVIMSYDASSKKIKLYVDGVKTGEKAVDINFSTAGTTFYLTGNNYLHLNGLVDDVLILNKTITDTEAQNIYNEKFQKFYNSGTAETIWQNITTGNNRVNLTLNTEQYNGTGVEARIVYSNGTYNNTNDGLVLYYHFDNDSAYGENDTHVYDFSGNGNNGSVYGYTTSPPAHPVSNGKYYGSFEFDGVDDAVGGSTDSSLNIAGQITIAAWVNMTNNWNTIVGKDAPYNSLKGYALFTDKSGYSGFRIGTGSGYVDAKSSTDIQNAGWKFVVGVYDGSSVKIYIDGKLITSTSYSGSIASTTKPLYVGNRPAATYFAGQIDEVMIWNRSLSDTEIENLYTNGRLYHESTPYQTFSSGTDTHTFNISNDSAYIKADIKYLSNSQNSYSSFSEGDIIFDVYNVTETPSTDTIPPQYSNIIETPTDPTIYSLGANYTFNVTWTDNSAVDKVILTWEGNNYSITSSGSEYSKTFTDLPAGTYTYSWWANDTSGNSNSTGSLTYTINKATSSCILLGDNATYPNTLNVNGSCNNPEATEKLYKDDIAISNPYSQTTGAGVYSFKINVSETQNYTSAEAIKQVEVYKGTPSLSISGTSPITYGTTTDVVGSGCPLELTCSLNPPNDIYGTGTITFNYSTDGNNNYTSAYVTKDIIINKATGTLILKINDTEANQTATYPTQSNISASIDNNEQSVKIYQNGEDITTQNNIYRTLGVGTYNITASVDSTQNYTAQSLTRWITINKNPSSCQIHFSQTSPITYGTSLYVWTDCDSDFTLYRDGVSIINNSLQDLSTGTYLFEVNRTDTQNYTNIYDSASFTINKANGLVYTYLNNTRANITIDNGTSIWLNGTLSTGVGTIKLYKNGTLINQGSSPLSNYTSFNTEGIYNISTIYSGNENYTSDYETWWVNATYTAPAQDTTPPTWILLNNKTCYVNQSCSHSVQATDESGIDTYWLNDTSVFNIDSSGNIWNITNLVNVTTYWLDISVNDTAGNTNDGVIYINVTSTPASQCNGNFTTLKSTSSSRPYGRLCYWIELK